MSRPISVTETITSNPVSYNTTDYSYASVSNMERAYNPSSNTTYATINLTTGQDAETWVYFNFDFSDIPEGATIDSVSCSTKAYINTTNSSRITSRTCQLYAGSTAKGSASTISNSTTAFNMTCGSWTRAELLTARLRLYAKRGSSNTTSTYNLRLYGATFTVTYSINGTAYTITAASSVTGITASPATQELLGGSDAEIRIDGASIEEIQVTDNDNDVTSSLVRHNAEAGSYTFTGIPTSFDSTNSVYNRTAGDSGDGIYSTNYIENGLTNHNSTTRCALYSVQGSGAVSTMYYNFDCSSIPANATITSVTCQFKGGSQGSSYYSSYIAQLTTGTTTKGTSQSVTGSNSSPTTVTISGGTWTRAELNNIKIMFRVTRGSSNTTTDSTWSFFGATLTVQYTISPENPYYWTYSLTNIAADHTILIEQAGAFVPPEEDPTKTYYSLTISAINATTDPPIGTTRLEAGSNQVVTITPTDPQLTLALDNGVDITNQLVGGIPSNTYTVTTQVSGASYGFNLNSSTGYYVSTNAGQSSSAAVARVNFNLETACLVTIQYINYAESTYDYGIFGNVDSALGTTYSADSNAYHSCNAASDNTSTAQTLTYDISAGTHFIDIKYRKDTNTDSNNDTLQWKIVSVESTEGGGTYTYTLSNIQAKHSLIFVFGNVSYYFITSSGTGARLYPDGQMVKLAGDNYHITIVPDNATDVVTLTDNNVDKTTSLEYEEGEDKYGNTVVNYIYRLTNINAAHTIAVVSTPASTAKIFVKVNGTWTQFNTAWKKVNGSWVEVEVDEAFTSGTNYVKGEVPISGYTATVSGANGGHITYNGDSYATGTSFTYSAGESATVSVSSRSNCYVYVDGTQVAASYNGILTYSYTLPACSVSITYENTNTATVTVYITTV